MLIDEEGRARTARSWVGAFIRDVPFGGLQIAIFEGVKTFIVSSPDIDLDVNTLTAEVLIGSLGGLIGALVTVPGDVIITKVTTQPDGPADAPPAGIVGTAQQIYAERGLDGFFDGAAARVLYWTPGIGIFLALYCSIRKAALGF